MGSGGGSAVPVTLALSDVSLSLTVSPPCSVSLSVCLPVSFSVSLCVSQSQVSVSGLTTHRPPASCSITSHAQLLACMPAKSHQLYPTLCDLMDCRLPGSSVHGVLQARILEWVAIPFSRGSSRPRDRTCVSQVSCIGSGFFTISTTWEALKLPQSASFSHCHGCCMMCLSSSQEH